MQFTFWHESDLREHITLRFERSGAILHLSRDKTKSVAPTWNEIGAWYDCGLTGRMRITFKNKVPHLWVAATQMTYKGAAVDGAEIRLASVSSRLTNRVTDPETLLGLKRKRSVDLGQWTAGERGSFHFRVGGRMGPTDVEFMRHAIEANRAARKR